MSTIGSAKIAMGYLQASQREACQRCKYAQNRGIPSLPNWYCKEGDFLTSANSTCGAFRWAHKHG